jgi:hypothetical protein
VLMSTGRLMLSRSGSVVGVGTASELNGSESESVASEESLNIVCQHPCANMYLDDLLDLVLGKNDELRAPEISLQDALFRLVTCGSLG